MTNGNPRGTLNTNGLMNFNTLLRLGGRLETGNGLFQPQQAFMTFGRDSTVTQLGVKAANAADFLFLAGEFGLQAQAVGGGAFPAGAGQALAGQLVFKALPLLLQGVALRALGRDPEAHGQQQAAAEAGEQAGEGFPVGGVEPELLQQGALFLAVVAEHPLVPGVADGFPAVAGLAQSVKFGPGQQG